MTTITTIRGGAWLIEATSEPIFTPERLSDEHKLIRQTAEEFVASEVMPVLDRLEQKDWTLARALVRRSGDLGLLGTDVPEAYGGVELDKVSSIVVGEAVGRAASFATTFGAQTGLAITPLLCFGTEEQKQRYLPGLVSGEIIGAYALERVGLGLRCARRQGAGNAAGRRQLRPQRREDVDHERRVRRPLHRLCQGGRGALHGVPRRAELPRRQLGTGGAQARTPRLVDDAAPPAGRAACPRATSSARSAAATRSPSTC